MFVALNHEGKLINSLDQELVLKEAYRCPSCLSPVLIRQGKKVRRHFAHVATDACRGYWENESPQHLSLKSSLYSWLQQETKVEVEKHLSELDQIADLLVEDRLAIEIQCSSLPISRLVERTQSYQEAGYQVLWLLGKDLWLNHRLTELHKQFLYYSQRLGFYLWEVDEKKKELRLRYLLHEDQHGKVQGLTKTFSFDRGNLLDIFRYPYQASLTSFQGRVDKHLLAYIAKQLYYQDPKWMKRQEEAYLAGSHLLAKSLEEFYPQIRLPQSHQGFVQIEQDVADYYQDFAAYYHRMSNRQQQILYPPVFYRQTVRKKIK